MSSTQDDSNNASASSFFKKMGGGGNLSRLHNVVLQEGAEACRGLHRALGRVWAAETLSQWPSRQRCSMGTGTQGGENLSI